MSRQSREKSLFFHISGHKIKEIRELKMLNQEDVANGMGVSRQTINSWEKKSSVKLDSVNLKLLASTLNVNTKDFTSVKTKEDDEKLIPFYDAIAVGGQSMLAEQEAIYGQPSEMINPGTFFRSATGSLRVYGHSMFPKYPAGCIIAFKNGTDMSVIHYGEDYVIELEDRRIVKRVQKSKEPGCIQVNSYNTMKDDSGSSVYSSYDIPLKAIKRMYMVLGLIILEASV